MTVSNSLYMLLRRFFYPIVIEIGRWILRFLSFIARIKCKFSGPIDVSQVNSVLITKLDNIGDFILLTPFLREFRRNFPNKSITLLVNQTSFKLAKRCPYVDEVLPLQVNVTGVLNHLKTCFRHLSMAKKLRHQKFDLALNARWDCDYYFSWLLMLSIQAKWRLTHSEFVCPLKEKQDHNLDRFYSHVLSSKTIQHEVLQNLAFIKFLEGTIENQDLELWINKEDRKWAAGFLSKEKLLPIFIGISASKNHKRWPLEKFIEIANWLVKSFECTVFFCATPEDRVLLESAKPQLNVKIKTLCNRNLWKIIALIESCHMVICNDSAPAHIAAAVKTPVLTINPVLPETAEDWSDYSETRFSPWNILFERVYPSKLACATLNRCQKSPAYMIHSISIETVKEAIINLIRQSELLCQPKK